MTDDGFTLISMAEALERNPLDYWQRVGAELREQMWEADAADRRRRDAVWAEFQRVATYTRKSRHLKARRRAQGRRA